MEADQNEKVIRMDYYFDCFIWLEMSFRKWMKAKPKPNIEWKCGFCLNRLKKGWQWWIKYGSKIVVYRGRRLARHVYNIIA